MSFGGSGLVSFRACPLSDGKRGQAADRSVARTTEEGIGKRNSGADKVVSSVLTKVKQGGSAG